MTPSNHVIDVSEADFEFEVVQYSQNVPVVVDFWAEWCAPCKTLGPILAHLAEEAQGSFRLAKVDIDANPNLAARFGVRGIPNVKGFVNGQVAAEFSGAIPEEKIREFLERLVPDEAGLAVEKGNGLLSQRQYPQAEKIFRETLETRTEHPGALLGLARSLIGQGRGQEARLILRNFPASREYASAQLLIPLADAQTAAQHGDLGDDTPLDAAFRLAIRLSIRGNVYAALDGLLDILRQDKRYRSDQARQVYLGLLELLGENDPQTRAYRADLSNVLF